MNDDSFWHIRSEKYDKLFWTKDKSYIEVILDAGDFKKTDIVLDIGTGTGIIANAIKPLAFHVIALDNSISMLEKGKWEGISFIKWDIAERIFHDGLFDKLSARMVFHHIFDELDRVFVRCYDLLKKNGRLIVAEGVPPSDDADVVDWYEEMFKYKEKRRVFTESQLIHYFRKTGFKKVKCYTHVMKNFSVKNWLDNSGINKKFQKKIVDMHINSDQKIKDLYNMKVLDDDCIIDTKNIIVTGDK